MEKFQILQKKDKMNNKFKNERRGLFARYTKFPSTIKLASQLILN